jgi:hypothetical protein
VTRSGQPNLDSGSAVEIHNLAAKQDQQAIPGPVEMQRNDPVVNPPQNVPILQKRGEMMMKIHDTLLANGHFDVANKLQKAEFDNIFQIAKISPQGAMQAWNSNPWITQQYGAISPQNLAQKGDWTFLKFGNDGLVRWNKTGQFEMIQKPSGKSDTQYTLVGNTPDGRPVNHDKTTGNYYVDGRPYTGRVLPKVEKVIQEGGGRGGGGSDLKEFRKEVTALNGLYKSRATIEKGYDPITGQVIPQDQITTAKATIQQQIERQEGIMQIEYPDQWAHYTKKESAAIGGKGKTGPTDANKEYNINKAADYFRENTMKYGQKSMYDTLIKAGYSEDSIKRAWKRYKGISD